ncbi:MAG TPA: histidine phosphatase family protein [Caulobacteraceae bacterium]|jgi:phosphohistidine phosphatase|nr:histidine phosphatase family protein [Caulobacteraceae bacterium]
MPLERLILLRHGKAEERAPSGKDFDRALAPRGHEEAREAGRRLAEAGLVPDLALVSPARRAIQTWEEVAAALPQTVLEQAPALYNASPATLLEAVECADAASVILVGHNPGIHALAAHLLAQGQAGSTVGRLIARGSFPTATAAVFRFEAGKPVCEAVFSPREEAGA